MQQLEQISRNYQDAPIKKESHSYGRLELYSLGVSKLYTGPLGNFGGGFGGGSSGGFGAGGFGGGSIFDRMDHFAASRPISHASRPLTIRDSPLGEFQLHIHEGIGGSAKLKTYGGLSKGIPSYDAAMLDLYGDKLGISKYFKKSRSDD